MNYEHKHTPGPWHLQPTTDGGFSIEKYDADHSGGLLVLCSRNPLHRLSEQSAANGRLIAAAPDMFAALQAVSLHLSAADDEGEPKFMQQVRAAIAKATGAAK